MSRVSSLSSPFLLGFDEIERVLDRVGKAADGYPPYNIERVARSLAYVERANDKSSGQGHHAASREGCGIAVTGKTERSIAGTI